MVVDNPVDLSGVDASSTYEWFESILAAFPEAAKTRVVVAFRKGEVVGLLPVVVTDDFRFGASLMLPTDLHGGRNGFLLREPDQAILAALFDGLNQVCPRWTTLRATLVVSSVSEQLLASVSATNGYRASSGEAMESVFIPLDSSPEEFLKRVGKDLRHRIKSSTRNLSGRGGLQYREFRFENDALDLLEAVLAVERLSWKHRAGSAITNTPRQENFYRAMFPRAMRCGVLYGLVASLEGKPVAYNFGLSRGGVFSSLKISQVESLSNYSLSHVLRLELINRLRTLGVQVLDSTGAPELYKARWSNASQLYSRRNYLIFNRTIRGRLVAMALRWKSIVARLWAHKSGLESPSVSGVKSTE